MGETSIDRFPFGSNRSLEVDGSDEGVSAEALLMRQILERSGVVSWPEYRLIDDPRSGSVVHSMGNLMCTWLSLLCQRHRGPPRHDPALPRHDPALAVAAEVLWRPGPRRWK